MGFLKSWFNGLSLSLKYNFLQRKLLKKKQRTGSKKNQKNKKRKTQQSKAKEERKKENILCKTFTTTVPWNFNLICFISFWRFFCHFTEQVIPSKIWSYNHVTPDRRLNVTSTSVSDITVRNTTELVACLCPLNCILHEDREVVRILIFFSLYKNGRR